MRQLVLGAVLVVLPLLLLRSGLKSPERLNAVDRVILRLTAPLQRGVTASVDAVQRAWKRYLFLVGVAQHNERLKQQNVKLRHELAQARRRLRQLHRYEKMLVFRSRHGVETIGARVIARPGSPMVRALRLAIDRGQEVVRTGMPVVAADGVVGRVGRTYGGYAEVILAADPSSAIDVVVPRSKARGLLRGVDDRADYACTMAYVLKTADVKVGDLVVTSGAGDVFPAELPVGRIRAVAVPAAGLYREVLVEPVVDFSTLRDALVILAPPPPEVAEQLIRTAPVRGFAP